MNNNCKKTIDSINEWAKNNPDKVKKRREEWDKDVEEFFKNIQRVRNIPKNNYEL